MIQPPVVKRFYRGLGRLSWPETGRVLKYKATAGGGLLYPVFTPLVKRQGGRAFTGGQMTFTSFTPINCNPSGTRLFLFTHTHTHTLNIASTESDLRCNLIPRHKREAWVKAEGEGKEGGGRGGCEGRNEGEDVVETYVRARRKEG